MSLYDQYRKEHPIVSEPSEFREIVESEVKQALEWYKDGCSWCDKLTTRPTTEEAEKAAYNALLAFRDASFDNPDSIKHAHAMHEKLIKMITGGVS